jgi:hypothetical protein
MSATIAQIGKGTTFGYSTALTSPTYTAVAEVLDIKMPKHTAEPVEIMRYDSPTAFPELIPSWCKGGEFEITITYNPTVATAIFALLNVLASFQITKPDAKTWSYQGIITEFGDELPLKDKMTCSFKVAISGAPTPTAASA